LDNNIHNSIYNHVSLWCYFLLYTITMKQMKVVYKATKKDLSMKTDIELQKKILKIIGWSLGLGTFWLIMLINFLFYFADSISAMFSQLFWAIINLLAWNY